MDRAKYDSRSRSSRAIFTTSRPLKCIETIQIKQRVRTRCGWKRGGGPRNLARNRPVSPPPIFHRLSPSFRSPALQRASSSPPSPPPSLPLPLLSNDIFSSSTGRFTSDRSWRSSVALVASTFPTVFTRTKLWEPLSLAAPSAAYVDHLETTPHKKPTPFRKHSSAGRACARQGGPLRACGRVSIKYREIRLWILISPVTNERRGRDFRHLPSLSIVLRSAFHGHRGTRDRNYCELFSFFYRVKKARSN